MNDQNTEYAMLGGSLIMAAAGIIALVMYRSGLDFVLDAAIATNTFWFGYRNYKANNLPAAKIVYLANAILVGLFTLISLLGVQVNLVSFLICGAATAAFGFAFMQLNNNPASQGTADFSKTPGMQAGAMLPSMPAATTHTPSAPIPAAAPHPTSAAPVHDDIAERLRELASLKEQGLITNAEYEKKRGEILKTV